MQSSGNIEIACEFFNFLQTIDGVGGDPETALPGMAGVENYGMNGVPAPETAVLRSSAARETLWRNLEELEAYIRLEQSLCD